MTDPIHPVPTCEKLPGRTQCPKDMHTSDPALQAATAGTLAGALVRFIAGYDPQRQTFSRTSTSFQIFGGLELSWMHAARSNAKDLLHRIASQLPAVAAEAWGPDEASRMTDYNYVSGIVESFNGLETMPAQFSWLLAGWHHVAPRADVQQLIADWYWSEIPSRVIDWMSANGLTAKRTLAAGVRARNSSGTQLKHLKDSVAEHGENEGVSRFLQEYKNGKYISVVDGWPEFGGQIDKWPSSSALGWKASDVPPAEQIGQFGQLASSSTGKTTGYLIAGLVVAGVVILGLKLAGD